MTPLGVPTNAYGYDINATGYVVGTSEVTGGGTHGYVWHDDNSNGVNDPGEMKDLNTQFSDATWTTLVERRTGSARSRAPARGSTP